MAFPRTGNTDYNRMMSLKTSQYDALICRAETQNRDNGGKPSKEEAVYYRDAAKVCEEIRDMNRSQRAVYNSWDGRAKDCRERMEEIMIALNPALAAPPAPAAAPASPFMQQTAPPPAARPAAQAAPAAPAAPVGGEAKPGRGVPKTTASGFTTYNAVKDVPADTIESWYKAQPAKGFESVSGMQELKERLMEVADNVGWTKTDEALGTSPVKTLFFYGPPGTGKSYIINAFAHELMDQGYKFLKLVGGDIHASLVGVAEKIVKIAFQEAVDNAPCILFIDEFDDVCLDRSLPGVEGHEKRLTVAFLQAYDALLAAQAPVILIGATNHPMKVDEAMLSRIVLMRMPLPDKPMRLEYFGDKFSLYTLEGLTIDDMAEMTDNYSFRDLSKVLNHVAERMKALGKEQFSVMDANGELDREASDARIADALKSGDLKLSRELFETALQTCPPSNNDKIMEELAEFEDRMNRL